MLLQEAYASSVFRLPITAHPVIVAQTIHRLPSRGIPQVAFVGHSNSGKSSLINGLLFGREVARTSRVAGRTRQLFTFDLGMRLSLVDLPGYGFAKVPAEMKKDWALLLEQYLERSTQLRRVVCLVDASAGVRTLDLSLWSLLLEKNKPFLVVVTKADLLTVSPCASPNSHRMPPPQQRSVLQPFVFAVSAKRSLGLTALQTKNPRADTGGVAAAAEDRHACCAGTCASTFTGAAA
ncbi:uncharacterized protein LOC34623423 [Cyclospora cayetanensis]|uniref:Uncharacterized protein LOC34623423 n=1 Tax=Cyclospora cayetanensis TaxID=88456 RepID=A0A6P6S104_9EIME|nr:uncharacterized protein LOC34623423 [Cyclospora cayetanensis]